MHVVLVLFGVLLAFPSASRGQEARPPERLSDLVAALEASSPALEAARRDIDMASARIRPAGALPDPTIGIGYMGGGASGLYRPFFPSGSTATAFQEVSVMQEIPYPGKLGLRTDIASAEAGRARWIYEDLRLRRVAALKEAYFDYLLAHRTLAILNGNRDVLERFRKVAEIRFSVGKAIQQDVLKAQLEISMLLERVRMVERDRTAALARLNGLLNRPSQTAVPPTLAFDVLPLPSLDDLQAAVRSNGPSVRRDEETIRRAEWTLALARQEVRPDFAVKFTSQRFPGDMPWMWGADVMVRIPLFLNRKQRPMISEAAAALDGSRRMRDDTIAMASGDIAGEYERAKSGRELMALYADSVIPQARLAVESSLASYEVGAVDFLSVLMNFSTLLNYEINHEQQQAMYHQALVRIEPLAGIQLVR